MRKFAISMCVFFCLPFIAVAQSSGDVQRGTVFGGYSLLHNNSNNFNGWNGQGTFNFTPHFGVTADISGNYRTLGSISGLGFTASSSQSLYNFLFGPTVTENFGRNAVFGHALFGTAHSNLSAGISVPVIGGISSPITSANAFAMAFGGGVDIGVTRHFAIRAAQIDYLRTNFNSVDALASGLTTSTGNHQNSFRYSGGVVWRF